MRNVSPPLPPLDSKLDSYAPGDYKGNLYKISQNTLTHKVNNVTSFLLPLPQPSNPYHINLHKDLLGFPSADVQDFIRKEKQIILMILVY